MPKISFVERQTSKPLIAQLAGYFPICPALHHLSSGHSAHLPRNLSMQALYRGQIPVPGQHAGKAPCKPIEALLLKTSAVIGIPVSDRAVACTKMQPGLGNSLE
jgi:hypothetical protein